MANKQIKAVRFRSLLRVKTARPLLKSLILNVRFQYKADIQMKYVFIFLNAAFLSIRVHFDQYQSNVSVIWCSFRNGVFFYGHLNQLKNKG